MASSKDRASEASQFNLCVTNSTNQESQQGCNNGLAVRPPKLHILPVLLHRFVKHIPEIQDAAMFFISSPLPYIIEHPPAKFNQVRIIAAVFRFLQDEPGAFDGMTRIKCASVNMVNDAAVRCHLFHHTAVIILYKILFYFSDPSGYPFITTYIANGFTQLLGSIHHDHRHTNAFGRPVGSEFGGQ